MQFYCFKYIIVLETVNLRFGKVCKNANLLFQVSKSTWKSKIQLSQSLKFAGLDKIVKIAKMQFYCFKYIIVLEKVNLRFGNFFFNTNIAKFINWNCKMRNNKVYFKFKKKELSIVLRKSSSEIFWKFKKNIWIWVSIETQNLLKF